jgi:hypothetical protein
MPRVHTPETRLKMSLAKKGKTPLHLVNYWKGRKQTAKHKAKSLKSLATNPHRYQKGQTAPMKGKKGLSGSDSPHWKGGVSQYKQKYNRLYYMRAQNAEGSHTRGEWETLKAQYGYRCPACLKHEPVITLTRDHIIPLSKGGSNYIVNIQPLCKRCNSVKKDRLIDIQDLTNG